MESTGGRLLSKQSAKPFGRGSRHVEPPSIELRILAFLGIIGFLYFARPVILPVVVACVAAMALRPLMEWLTKYHIPRVVSAMLVMSAFVAVAGLVLAQLEGPAVKWINRAPEYKERLEKFSDRVLHSERSPGQAPTANPGEPGAARAPSQIDYKIILAWTGSTLSGALEAMVLLFLLLTSENWASEKLEQMCSTRLRKRWAKGTITEIQHNISSYLFSISIINAVLGAAVGAGLAVMRFPNAMMWGVMAALLNYIPYFGPIVGIILVGIVSFFTGDSITKEALPVCWYLAAHVLESDVITPILLGRRFTIHPVMILISLIFWTWIWGVLGALLAVPFLTAAKVISERAPSLWFLSELLTNDRNARKI
jgi:predicted PurR-regulated permease PerM